MGGDHKVRTFLGYYLDKIRPNNNNTFSTFEGLKKIGKEDRTLNPVSLVGIYLPTDDSFKKTGSIDDVFDTEDKIFTPLVSALKQTSLSGSFDKYLVDLINMHIKDKPKSKQELEKIISHSLGRSHNALMDLVGISISFNALTRESTLLLASFERGINMLQKSTRRVEHGTYLIPESINNNLTARKLFKETISKVQRNFNEILDSAGSKKERISLREEAMYIQPLALVTSDYVTASWRGWLQFLMEVGVSADENGNMIIDYSSGVSSDARKLGVEVFNKLKEISPWLVKKWSTNYTKSQFYPSAGLFFNKKNKKLEDLIGKAGGKDFLIGGYNNPLGFTEEDILYVLDAISEGDEPTLANLKMTDVSYLAKMDLSLLHEFLRHRTIQRISESIYHAADEAYKHLMESDSMNDKFRDFYIPSKLRKSKYENLVKDSYKELMELRQNLIKLGIPEGDANVVIPHGLIVHVLAREDAWNLSKLSGERMCATAKFDMQVWMDKLKRGIFNYENKNNLGHFMSSLMVPKCASLGYCPEHRENSCNKRSFIYYKENLRK